MSKHVVATMMDEAEEEALFARLRGGLQAARHGPGAAALAGRTEPDRELVAAVARVEAGLRTLAIRHDAAMRHADALEQSIEPRIEAAVARTTAALRADLDRLAVRPSSVARRQARRRAPAKAALFALALVLTLVLAGTAVTWFAGPFEAGPLARTLAASFADWRATLEAR